ncbi:MAG: DUF302 domain-containing protein [Alphaproteobacteria bacterium]|nr:DUF302 domain-containing protein [Alphaproteobacteria bacterium]
MFKLISGFIAGVIFVGVVACQYAGGMMLNEYESPFGLEETAARIQANIKDSGWALSGLRSPSATIKAMGSNVPNVLLVEACNVDYSKPLIKDDDTRILSILMPCTITVYEKGDKVYIGLMNSGLMGQLFGAKVAGIMEQVAQDQKKFITFDPSKPAPALIRGAPGGGGQGGKKELGGC